MLTETVDQQLTEAQWELAHGVAKGLVIADADVNELQKAIAYLRSVAHHDDAVERFFKYLATLVSKGRQVAHSKRTEDYYRSLDITCSKYLKGRVSETGTLLQILGWAARLVKYYKNAGPIGEKIEMFNEPEAPIVTERQLAIQKVLKSKTFEVGHIIDAEVQKKHATGRKVTYRVFNVPYTEKESKKGQFEKVPDAGPVKVEVKSLKDDGSINHVKFHSLA